MNREKILVWDLPTRLFHWLLAGTLLLDLKSSYAQFAHLHLNNQGVVRHRTA